MEQGNLEKLKGLTEEFFEKMGFEVQVAALEQRENGTVSLNLKTKDARVLIGEGGQTLFEIQHLLKAILRRNIEENFYLDLDINDYKKRKIEYLKEMARSVVQEVLLTGEEKELPPMSAQERRIVHMEIASRGGVTTQSIGREPDRRIVISPSSTPTVYP